MSSTHQKKRNTGLLFAFLVQTISRSLVEGDTKKSNAALKILRRHFKPGTELYKEFRLINALFKTTVSSPTVAGSILSEAKSAARAYDEKALDRAKSLLIKNINHVLNDENFYDQHVNEYRMYATIQTLLNDWRSPDRDIERIAKYEDQLTTWLITEKAEPEDHVISEESPGTSRLLMKVMMKKLNEKYSGVLNEDQRGLVRAYAFAAANDDETVIKKKLVDIKSKLLSSIDEFKSSHSENDYINNKLVETRERLVQEVLDVVNDETVTRFMLYIKLGSELETGDADV